MRLVYWIRRHQLLATVVSFGVLTAPQWVASVWALFSSEPLVPWLLKHHIPRLGFSPWFITVPAGVVMFSIVLLSKSKLALLREGRSQAESKRNQGQIERISQRLDSEIEKGREKLDALKPIRTDVDQYYPRLTIACDSSVEGCVVEAPWAREAPLIAKFFRVAVNASGKTVKNCTGFLRRVEKNGEKKWGGNNEKLTFAPGRETDALSKTIRHEVPEFLDILVINSGNQIFPGTKGLSWPHLPRINDIFGEAGEYVLTIAVTGDDVSTVTARLKFTWTQNWETAALTLIPELSTQPAQTSAYPHVPPTVLTHGMGVVPPRGSQNDKPLRPIEIRDALDDFIQQGEQIFSRWNARNDAQLRAEVTTQSMQWLVSITDFVKKHLDVQHVDKLKNYQQTVEGKDRWAFVFHLASLRMSPQEYPIPFEIGYKIQVLKYFRNEIR